MATRWGICSAGKISHDFLVALKTLPATEHQAVATHWGTCQAGKSSQGVLVALGPLQAVAIAARDLARAQDYAQKHGIPGAYGSYEELARDPDVDVVYVGVIHPEHLPVGRLFLGAGKPVLLEKPLGMNAAEVRELVQLARSRGVFLMEAYWTRFFPASERLYSLLSQGALGELKVVRAEFGAPLSGCPRIVQKELGGGALLDIGCYCVQFATMVFGERPESILASGFLLPTGVDETLSVILNYRGKRQAVITCSVLTRLPNQAAISGTKGIIQLPSEMWSPTELVVNGQHEEFSLPPPAQPLNFPKSTGLRYEAQHVRQCLLKGLKESPMVSLAHSELVASILDEVRRQVGVTYPQDRA